MEGAGTAPGPGAARGLRSVRGKLTVFVAALVAITTVAVAWTGYVFVRDMLRHNVHEQLNLHSAGLQEVLLAYVLQQHERASLVASRTRLRQLLARRIDGELEPGPFLSQTRRILVDAKRSTASFLEIRIADPSGIITTATDDGMLGKDVVREAAYIAGRSEPVLGLPRPRDGENFATLSAPARTNDGRELGVVLIELEVTPMLELLGAIRSGYASAEIRLAAEADPPGDGDARYLFRLPGDDRAGKVTASEDAAMHRALEGETGFRDTHPYRGRNVLAAYRPLGYRSWALVAQVDADEAYAAIDRLRVFSAVIGVAITLCGGFAAHRIATHLTRPILALSRAANTIEGGDLSARAEAQSHDELGELCHAFNHMAASLQRHRDHLQELVSERTKALERSRDQLEGLVQMLERQAEVIQRDLHRAEIIQRSLLPRSLPPLPDFSVQTLYRPGRNVGGDLYDVVGIGDRHVALVIADASGHGVSAAMLSVLFKHRLRIIDESTGKPHQPGDALKLINDSLRTDVSAPGMFITAAYGLLDPTERTLRVSSAGHTPLLWLHADGETTMLEATGPALGLYSDASFGERVLELAPGDQVLLFTDGLLDANPERQMSPMELADTLRTLSGETTPLQKLLAEVEHGGTWEDRDDATVVLLDARPGMSNVEDTGEREQAASVASPTLELSWGERGDATVLSARGRATWTYAETFLAAADSVLNEGRRLDIELAECEYLDSTFLGTLFQIVSQADRAGVPLAIYNVSGEVRTLLEELAMQTVLEHVSESELEIPAEMIPLAATDATPTQQQLRVLRAHELLTELSESNREQFEAVVSAVRSELGRTGSSS